MPQLIVYVSDVSPGLVNDKNKFQKALMDIGEVAKRRNAEVAINGVLLVDRGHFIQLLEGDSDSLNRLLNKIKLDRRHSNLTVLIDEPIPVKSFNEWNMDLFLLDDHSELPRDALEKFRDSYLKNEKARGVELSRWIKRLIMHEEIRFSGTQI